MESNDYVLLRPSEWHVMTRYAEGRTPKQISLELGYSPRSGTVSRIIARPKCRQWLRQYYAMRERLAAQASVLVPLVKAGLLQPPTGIEPWPR
jgi:hypothetical protein